MRYRQQMRDNNFGKPCFLSRKRHAQRLGWNQKGAAMKNAPLALSAYSLIAGLCLMCFALVLHPMSPGDFLELAMMSPLATVEQAYGIQAAVLFWAGAVPAAAGVAGLLRRAFGALRHREGGRKRRARAALLREGWSY
jgi:hypothetical protein